jgi:putative spermidine/putrescine transport system permease protein
VARAAETLSRQRSSDPAGALRRQARRKIGRGLLLALPLFAYILIFFLLPIGGMLVKAVWSDELPSVMPESAVALRAWPGTGVPPEEVLAVVVRELKAAYEDRTAPVVARRLNFENAGYRSLILAAGRRLPDEPDGTWAATLSAIDPRWGTPELWAAFRRAASPGTDFHLLAALDLERDAGDAIVRAPPEEAIYRDVLVRTLWISALVTLFCLVLGYPLAYRLATLKERHANLLIILVLLPFWTSLLVRTASWIVLLQREGPVNQLLQGLGIIGAPLQLVFNRTGVLVAMTHVLLPFMVLPLYSVMRGIPPSYMRAAMSLGAWPLRAFVRVYLPLSMPGVAAGCLLVFILAIGYYITPALVGGAADQMISSLIAFFTLQTANWGMAAALGSVLLAVTMLLYLVYARVVGIDRLRLG